MTWDRTRFAAALDSTHLRLDGTEEEIRQLCVDAVKGGFACVMIYPTSVPLAVSLLRGTPIRVGTVIGFPSGRFTTKAKAAEINAVAAAGANEVDIVLDYGALKAGHVAGVAAEVAELTRLAHGHGQVIKVITENCFLTEEERLLALRICEDAGADFIKTSTGFGTQGAKAEDIKAWAAARKGGIQLKAAGGIRNLADAMALLDAGAARLGTSSAVALLAEFDGKGGATRHGSY